MLNFPYGLRPEVADALSEHERALMGFRTWETYGTSDEFGAEWARPGKDNTDELRWSPFHCRDAPHAVLMTATAFPSLAFRTGSGA